MKKKIMMSLMTIGMSAALVGGATFAIFSDTATNEGNSFAAGTVDITVGEPVQTTAIDLTNLAPGDKIEGKFTVNNVGSLDAKITELKANLDGALADDLIVTFTTPTAPLDAKTGSVDVPYVIQYSDKAEVQGETGSLNFTVTAQQLRNNP